MTFSDFLQMLMAGVCGVSVGLMACLLFVSLGELFTPARRFRLENRQMNAWVDAFIDHAQARRTKRSALPDLPLSLVRDPHRLLLVLPDHLERLGDDLTRWGDEGQRLAAQLRHMLGSWLRLELENGERFLAFRIQNRRIQACLRILCSAPSCDFLPTLLSVATFKEPKIAVEALRAIGCGARFYEAATVPLASRLRHATGAVRWAAFWALKELLVAHPRNIPLLARDPHSMIRLAVLRAIEAKAPDSIPELDGILDHGSRDVEAAIRTLAIRLQMRRTSSRVPILVKALSDPVLQVRINVLNDLGSHPDFLPHLITAYSDIESRLNRALANALSRTPKPLPTKWVERQLALPRGVVLEALAQVGDLCLVDILLPLLADPTPDLRRSAAKAVASLARGIYPSRLKPRAIECLRQRLLVESEVGVLAALIEAITFTADRESVTVLIERIPTAPPVLRERLVEASSTLERLCREADRQAPEISVRSKAYGVMMQ